MEAEIHFSPVGGRGLPQGLWFHEIFFSPIWRKPSPHPRPVISLKSYQAFYFFSRVVFRNCWPAKTVLSPIEQLSSQERDGHSPRDHMTMPIHLPAASLIDSTEVFFCLEEGVGRLFLQVKTKFHDLRKGPDVRLPLSFAVVHGSFELLVQMCFSAPWSLPITYQGPRKHLRWGRAKS